MKHKVNLIEFESGWGSRIDEVREFDSLKKAQAFVTKFNSKNTETTVPSWYMIAELVRGQHE